MCSVFLAFSAEIVIGMATAGFALVTLPIRSPQAAVVDLTIANSAHSGSVEMREGFAPSYKVSEPTEPLTAALSTKKGDAAKEEEKNTLLLAVEFPPQPNHLVGTVAVKLPDENVRVAAPVHRVFPAVVLKVPAELPPDTSSGSGIPAGTFGMFKTALIEKASTPARSVVVTDFTFAATATAAAAAAVALVGV